MNEYIYEKINIGLKEEFKVKIDRDKEDIFRTLTGDINPLHKDDDFAKLMLKDINGHISFGMLTASFYSTLAGVYLPGKYSLIHSIDTKFKSPVFVGDELTITGVVREKQDELKLIIIDAKIINQDSKVVSKALIKIIVLK